MVLPSVRLVASALLLASVPLAWTPLQLAVANDSFLLFSPLQFLPALALMVVVAAALVIGAVMLVPRRHAPTAEAAVFALAVAGWAVSWTVDPQLAFMDRAPPADAPLRWDDLAIFAAAGACAFAATRRWARESSIFAGVLVAGLAANAGVQLVRAESMVSWQPPSPELAAFSSKGNVLVILLDALQNDMLQDILARQPDIAPAFSGFTNYVDVVAPASTTYLSLPAIHAGAGYVQGESIRALHRQAIVQDSFMAKLADRGYRTLLLNPILEHCPRGAAWCGHQSAYLASAGETYAKELGLLASLGTRRSIPSAVAAAASGAWRFDFDVHGSIRNGRSILAQMESGLTVDDGPPRAKFLHLLATHAPAQLTAACEPFVSLRPWDRLWMREQAVCALRSTASLLQRMKASGVYDNTTIIIVSDHGGGFAREDDTASDESFTYAAGLAHAVLAYKPPRATGLPRTSHEPVSLHAVSTFACADGRCDPARPAPASRHFMLYDWRDALWSRDQLVNARLFEVAPGVLDRRSWRMAVGSASKKQADELSPALDSAQLGFGWGDADDEGARWVFGRHAQAYVWPQGASPSLVLTAAASTSTPHQEVTVRAEGHALCRIRLSQRLENHACSWPAGAPPLTAGTRPVRIDLDFAQSRAVPNRWQPHAARVSRIALREAQAAR